MGRSHETVGGPSTKKTSDIKIRISHKPIWHKAWLPMGRSDPQQRLLEQIPAINQPEESPESSRASGVHQRSMIQLKHSAFFGYFWCYESFYCIFSVFVRKDRPVNSIKIKIEKGAQGTDGIVHFFSSSEHFIIYLK